MAILVTGGMGYIGSHTCIEILNEGNQVIIVDNLSNSKYETASCIEKITGKNVKFYDTDVLNEKDLESVFEENEIEAVIHFAGLKSVEESILLPLKYYNNNMVGTITLCRAMNKYSCKNLVFSSSATVYGTSNISPLVEEMPLSATNPYGRTKLMVEEFLRDLYISDNQWSIILLRYFNPIGAHKSGLNGENPKVIQNNLLPLIANVAIGQQTHLNIYGNDYNTSDGTCIRDYIHVCDVANGHIKALDRIRNNKGIEVYNLGTGTGYSVLEVIKTFEKISGINIKYEFTSRRLGDIAISYADNKKAKELLGWECKYNLEDMCMDLWNFIKKI